MEPYRVLIVDDESDFRLLLVEALESLGYTAEGASSAEAAIERIREQHFAIVFTDLNMPGGKSGLELMHTVQSLDPRTFCILMTGFATTEAAIQALKRGAYDFITKPFKLAEMEASLNRALNHYKSLRENEAYQSRLEEMVLERTQEILQLKDDIENLFEGFVKASVLAIEARDPSTSGHSARVADLTVGLAEAVNHTPNGLYGRVTFSEQQIKEIRYAGLLHDFGKVGVREQVLTKAKKLAPERLERILQRLYQRDMEIAVAALERAMGEGQAPLSFQPLFQARNTKSRQLVDLIQRCNEPMVIAQEIRESVEGLADVHFHHWQEGTLPILEREDIAALRIARGSLSEEEREEINSHVTHTWRFLSQIPWPRELAQVPDIAYAHHERMNGRGYPRGLKGDEIPVQSRLMAVTDVFDGLTAADRPYKAALPLDRSLEILDQEARAGLLDQEALRIFLDAKVYHLTVSEEQPV
nr:HD domain-containing phosphohydrolase [uncultured Holophaga sp.]